MNATDPNTTPTPTQDDYLARADELMNNGHELGAAVLYELAGFPEIANMLIESGHDIVDDNEE